jgi:hypothetical protein
VGGFPQAIVALELEDLKKPEYKKRVYDYVIKTLPRFSLSCHLAVFRDVLQDLL